MHGHHLSCLLNGKWILQKGKIACNYVILNCSSTHGWAAYIL